MRAKLNRFEDLVFFDDAPYKYVGSFVPEITDVLPSLRAAALLDGALRDLTQSWPDPRLLDRIPMVLAIPDYGTNFERTVIDRLPRRPEMIVHGGSTTGLELLAEAARLLEHGSSHVLVCAADSRVTGRGLLALRESGRLRRQSAPQGVIPGEAAACVLVEPARPDTIHIAALGRGVEPATFANDLPLQAEGLTAAWRRALGAAQRELDDIDWHIADHGDESFFVKQHEMALTRLLTQSRPNIPRWQPTDFMGDVGTATGLVEIIWAAQAWARGYAPGAAALCSCSDAGGGRAAVIIARE
ncbi:3-oxoacyl-(acyl-carrier-protein) synthase [Enhygromyxa salina]|uniref:3-oxoacyl-(Acyl-carrier-protein) synthase n=2 Tax=Enhygromyxa salina TaxID=215803 RepID=A0A0C2A6J2_9BACT|nr:3-oxoacyl-(acyl-carrier-protein) synthase [Enhygromyxa salina]